MAIFFNGRKIVSPATVSAVDDSAMFNRGLSVGNVLAIVGRSQGGEPLTAIRLGGPQDARRILRGGEGLKAVEKAFDPSAQTGAPATVVFVRVNPAEQASLTLQDAGDADVIELVSSDYGLYTNQIRVKVESGTVRGKRISTQFGNDYFTQDDVYRDALSVHYVGGAPAATVSVTGTSVVLAVDAATVATLDLNVHTTVEQLVDAINAVPDFSASALDGNNTSPTLNGLDTVTDQDVTAAYTVTGDLQAIVDWINGQAEGLIDATRVAGAGTLPANTDWVYLSGGTDGAVTNAEWAEAFDEVLQKTDVQFVVPLSGEASIHAMADSHVAYMSNVAGMERRAICGTVTGTSDADALDKAKAINSDRTSLTHIGFYDFNAAGQRTLYPAYMLAALLGGAFAGSNPGTALTNKALKVRGLERSLRNPTDTDVLLEGGVLCVEDTPTGYKVVQSISTWLVNDNYNRREVSTGIAVDFTARNIRQALDVLRGEKNTPILLARAINIAETALRELARAEPQGPGVLAGDDDNPAYRNIQARIEGDALYVEFQCSPVIPANYIPVTIFAVPYSGTAAA